MKKDRQLFRIFNLSKTLIPRNSKGESKRGNSRFIPTRIFSSENNEDV